MKTLRLAILCVLTACGGGSLDTPSTGIAPGVAAALGSVTVSWNAPTTNADGSDITGIASYGVYVRSGLGAFKRYAVVPNPATPEVAVKLSLPLGVYDVAVSTVNAAGSESQFSYYLPVAVAPS